MAAAYQLEINTGRKPKYIYLGSRKSAELRNWLEENDFKWPAAPLQVAGYGPREQFNAMEVYRVDDPDHLNIA